MEKIALNTVIAIMMAIFPGFLFRKFYYRGEFTKQLSQSNEFDKLLWNVFFSAMSIGITFFSIYFFKSFSGLEVLDSINYDTVNRIASPISNNEIPQKDVIDKTYKDLLLIVTLIYFFSCFFGITLHWLVRALGLDVYFTLFRFKNYWYYYIHGGKILYSNRNNKKPAFTKVDVMCEIAGETKMYSGILSQYTISHDNNDLENIFLTNARALKQVKDDKGETVEVRTREIPGAAFCIPYKTVVNMNLVYVYRDDRGKSYQKIFVSVINIAFFFSWTCLIVSLWFDLSGYGISGFWNKFSYACWSFVALTNVRLFLYNLISKLKLGLDWVGQISAVAASISGLLFTADLISFWAVLIVFGIAIIFTGLAMPSNGEKKVKKNMKL